MQPTSQAALLFFCLLGTDPTPAAAPTADALIQRHAKENSPVWVEGDVVTFFYRGEAEKVHLFSSVIGEIKQLARLHDSDVWTLNVTRPDLERGIFTYSVIPSKAGQLLENEAAHFGEWRGPKAPPALPERTELKGQVKQFEIESRSLGTKRKLTVYLPAGHDPSAKAPVVYAADGGCAEGVAQRIEPLIDSGRIRPLVIVGVHSEYASHSLSELIEMDPQNDDLPYDVRTQEYVPGFNSELFAKHESFFCQEVPEWAEREFGISSLRADRAVFGFSNGGVFAVEMGRKHPDLFGYVFGFSCGAIPADRPFEIQGTPQKQSHYYLAAGTWEEGFYKCTSRLATELSRQTVPVDFSSRVAGHDPLLWDEEFVRAALAAFARK